MHLSKQPLTHSICNNLSYKRIVRNSQSRRQSSQYQLPPQQQLNNTHFDNHINTHIDTHINTNPNNRLVTNSSHTNIIQQTQSQYIINTTNPNPNPNNMTKSQYQQNNNHLLSKQQYQLLNIKRRENIVVCQSLPKTKPKYSFTFGQYSQKDKINNNGQRYRQHQRQHFNQHLNQHSNQHLNQHQQKLKLSSSMSTRNIRKDIDICLYTIADKLNSNHQHQHQYQQQYQYQQQQNNQNQTTRQFLANKLGKQIKQQPGSEQYRPSFSQLRKNKNKRMFFDKSIHRIHPEIVQEYIETVYREYDIPRVLKKIDGDNRQKIGSIEINVNVNGDKNQQQQQVVKQQLQKRSIVTQQQTRLKQQKIQSKKLRLENQQQQRVTFLNQQQRVTFLNQQQQQKPKNNNNSNNIIVRFNNNNYQSQYTLHNTKQQHIIKNNNNNNNLQQRRNNFITSTSLPNQQQLSLMKSSHNKNTIDSNKMSSKRRFLNITLSKQKKSIITMTKKQQQQLKKHQQKLKNKQQILKNKQQILKNKQQPKQSLYQSRLSSKSHHLNTNQQAKRSSSSQKKIMQIKKNISQWKDNQHQYQQRYSYLSSPYQMICQQKGKQRKEEIQNKGFQQQSSSRVVNVVVRPFEEMMRVDMKEREQQQYQQNRQQQQQQQIVYAKHPNTTNPYHYQTTTTSTTQYITNPTSSQYQPNNITNFTITSSTNNQHSHLIPQQFRYCVLCQQRILTINLLQHEQRCIGWIDDQGNLIMFKQLYSMTEDKLTQVIKTKVKQIKKRIDQLIEKLSQQQTAKQSQKQYKQSLDNKILQTVIVIIHNYTLLQQNSINSINQHSLKCSFDKLNKIVQNDQSLKLLQQTQKLCWFIKLVQGWDISKQRRNQSVNTNTNMKQIASYNNKQAMSTYQSQQIKQKSTKSQHQNNLSTMTRMNQSLSPQVKGIKNLGQQNSRENVLIPNPHVSEFIDVRRSTF